jgi:hypothetical protein
MSNEMFNGPNDPLAELTAKMESGLNRLTDNEELETAYLAYQADVLDQTYGDNPNVVRIDQLSEHERDQVDALATRLVDDGLISPTIVSRRLDRIRILTVDEYYSSVTGDSLGGEYKDGLVIIATSRGPILQNHAMLHEIAHGLAAPGWIALSGESALDFGTGLTSKRTASGGAVGMLAIPLYGLEEAIIDTSVLGISDIDVQAHAAGAFPKFGYWREDNALAALTASHPDLVREMNQAVFSNGLQNPEQGRLFVEAFKAFTHP